MSEKLSWRIKNVDVNYSKISTIGKIWIFLLKESVMNSRSHLDQIYFSKQSLIHVPIKAFSIVTLDFIWLCNICVKSFKQFNPISRLYRAHWEHILTNCDSLSRDRDWAGLVSRSSWRVAFKVVMRTLCVVSVTQGQGWAGLGSVSPDNPWNPSDCWQSQHLTVRHCRPASGGVGYGRLFSTVHSYRVISDWCGP